MICIKCKIEKQKHKFYKTPDNSLSEICMYCENGNDDPDFSKPDNGGEPEIKNPPEENQEPEIVVEELPEKVTEKPHKNKTTKDVLCGFKPQNGDIQQLDLSVIDILHVKNSSSALAKLSKETYNSTGVQYNNYLEETNQSVNIDSIKNYLYSQTWQPSTYNLKINALKKLILNQQHFLGNPILSSAIQEAFKQNIKRVKINKSIMREDYCTEDEIKEIVSKNDEWIGFIIEYLFKTGCRVSEMINTKLVNIKSYNDTTEINIVGKGNKQRTVYIDPILYFDIKNHFFPKVYLFETKKHTPYDRSNVWDYTLRAGIVCGIYLNPHKLRHSCAMHLKHQNKDSKYIQQYLGHTDVATTIEHYFHDKVESNVTQLFS